MEAKSSDGYRVLHVDSVPSGQIPKRVDNRMKATRDRRYDYQRAHRRRNVGEMSREVTRGVVKASAKASTHAVIELPMSVNTR